MPEGEVTMRLGSLESGVDATLAELARNEVVLRIWERDHTVWQDDPTEVANRLGWLDSPVDVSGKLDELEAFADEVAADGFTDAVVLGMGGSSLFAETLARTFPPDGERLRLHVLDSTDPAAVLRAEAVAPLERVFFLVASKSGTTIETRSHLAHFWERTGARGAQFAAITDRGTPLGEIARERSFRHLFQNRADIGGRYSALSFFGLVPAVLAGVDAAGLVAHANVAAKASGPDVAPEDAPAVRLGVALGVAGREGRDKLTLLLPPEVAAFGAWIEQLIAESTGKSGTGILPVVDEPVGDLAAYGDDRMFVSFGPAPGGDDLVAAGHPLVELDLAEALELGGQVYLWELATAVAGAVLGVNPFDQPDVAAAKESTARALQAGVPDAPTEPLAPLLETVEPGDYLALLAYVDPGDAVTAALQRRRVELRDELQVATTLGIGPRYLHSTGQFHKGGPDTGVFVQVVSDDAADVPIPGQPHGFSTLKRAQAAGDLEALRSRGARVARVSLAELLAG